jgi:peptidoglycan hydrolase-like protein with peptidoglycan-binding domain
MKRFITLTCIFPLLVGLACNLPGPATPEPGNLLTQVPLTLTAVALTPSAIPSTPTATATLPGPTATTVSQACNQASFVSDVSYPDDTQVALNTPFVKTWRLRNTGTCTWTSSYQLVFDSGDKMSGPDSQQLTNGSVAPGNTVDVSVSLTSPNQAGTYRGNWELREPGGATFALSTGPFWVQIKAGNAPVSLPDWPLYKVGDGGVEVYAIQHLLLAHGEALDADGVFGPITKQRVMHFQSENSLSADGIVGPQTWPKLIILAQEGSHGQQVRAIQRLLKDKFGYNLNIDGIFGPITEDAVRDYQSDHGLTVDGIVGQQTWRSMIGE